MNREPSPAGPSTSSTPASSHKSGRETGREERTGFNYAEAYPSSTYLPAIPWSVHNKIMRQAAAGLCFISSFDSSTQTALEMVTHLMSSYMTSICQQTKTNCEIAGRTIPIPTDVWLGLVNLGHDVESLPVYMNQIYTGGNLVIPPPKVQLTPQHALPLKIGMTRGHPSHVNEFLPPFPDPHTYIRTEISGEPDTSYEKVRELAAQRKRDTEMSLVDFMLRVHPRTCLFRDYEAKVKEDAQLALHERERQKEALKAAERQAKAVEQLRQDVKMELTSEIPENFMEDDERKPTEEDGLVNDEEDVDLDLEETETSLILRKIPAWCNVLDPSLETRPYLSALVSEELQDDETSESAKAGRQQSKTGEEFYDNAYLRPPRMPAKGSYVQF